MWFLVTAILIRNTDPHQQHQERVKAAEVYSLREKNAARQLSRTLMLVSTLQTFNLREHRHQMQELDQVGCGVDSSESSLVMLPRARFSPSCYQSMSAGPAGPAAGPAPGHVQSYCEASLAMQPHCCQWVDVDEEPPAGQSGSQLRPLAPHWCSFKQKAAGHTREEWSQVIGSLPELLFLWAESLFLLHSHFQSKSAC